MTLNYKEYEYGLNFILNSLRGGNYDEYYRDYKNHIDPFIQFLQLRFKPKPQKVYRGILLDPVEVEENNFKLKPISQITYLSFSEDLSIAKVFADMNSSMADLFRLKKPAFEGYLIETIVQPNDIIFHHSWASALGIERYFGSEVRVVYEQKEVMIKNNMKTFDLTKMKRGCSSGQLVGCSN